MDVASKLVGSLTITDATSFPISYKVKYDPSLVKPGHQYSMSARITGSDGKLLYINDVNTRADLSGATNPNVDIAVIKGQHFEKIYFSLLLNFDFIFFHSRR